MGSDHFSSTCANCKKEWTYTYHDAPDYCKEGHPMCHSCTYERFSCSKCEKLKELELLLKSPTIMKLQSEYSDLKRLIELLQN